MEWHPLSRHQNILMYLRLILNERNIENTFLFLFYIIILILILCLRFCVSIDINIIYYNLCVYNRFDLIWIFKFILKFSFCELRTSHKIWTNDMILMIPIFIEQLLYGICLYENLYYKSIFSDIIRIIFSVISKHLRLIT